MMQLRTTTRDREDAAPLPDDLPSPGSHTIGFMVRLLVAWVAMGLRVPKIMVGDRPL
jgi:hypothetical protein